MADSMEMLVRPFATPDIKPPKAESFGQGFEEPSPLVPIVLKFGEKGSLSAADRTVMISTSIYHDKKHRENDAGQG